MVRQANDGGAMIDSLGVRDDCDELIVGCMTRRSGVYLHLVPDPVRHVQEAIAHTGGNVPSTHTCDLGGGFFRRANSDRPRALQIGRDRPESKQLCSLTNVWLPYPEV